MKIQADEQTQALAKKALEIQDACNPYPVANFLLECIKAFGGHDRGLQHPVTLCVLNKLNHLAQLTQSRSLCFDRADDLAKGIDVEWGVVDCCSGAPIE